MQEKNTTPPGGRVRAQPVPSNEAHTKDVHSAQGLRHLALASAIATATVLFLL